MRNVPCVVMHAGHLGDLKSVIYVAGFLNRTRQSWSPPLLLPLLLLLPLMLTNMVVAVTAPKCAIVVCDVAWRVVAVWMCNIVS